ncbi:unnamed protein product [Orchesella dallaii]|uniref:Uncharacterized protein n=1 Tax=Orchesella dallaii TaxID=48710 RepID=A0ABP1R929_9HEXA
MSKNRKSRSLIRRRFSNVSLRIAQRGLMLQKQNCRAKKFKSPPVKQQTGVGINGGPVELVLLRPREDDLMIDDDEVEQSSSSDLDVLSVARFDDQTESPSLSCIAARSALNLALIPSYVGIGSLPSRSSNKLGNVGLGRHEDHKA